MFKVYENRPIVQSGFAWRRMESTKALVDPFPLVPVICITLRALSCCGWEISYTIDPMIVLNLLTVYPTLSRYSIISGIANSLARPPDTLTASNVAAFDWREFRCSTASWYVLVDIGRPFDEFRVYLIPWKNRGWIDTKNLEGFHCIANLFVSTKSRFRFKNVTAEADRRLIEGLREVHELEVNWDKILEKSSTYRRADFAAKPLKVSKVKILS